MRSTNSTPSRPASRQSSVSTATASRDTNVKRKPAAAILTRAPVSRLAAGNNSVTTSRTTAPSLRAPLGPRDKNVAPITTRLLAAPMRNLKAAPAPPTMPFDKDASSTRKPTLAKSVARAPLTPKVASRTLPPTHQTVTLATPLPRRTARPDSTPRSGDVAPSSNTHQRDELVSPVPAFLSSNVTPRSGSRQTRVDSASSTPNGTPNPDRSDGWETRSMGISGHNLDERLRQSATFSPATPETGRLPQSSSDSKFFFASDAKQVQQPAAQKSSIFFYANGETIPQQQNVSSPVPLTPILGSTSVPQTFWQANSYMPMAPPTYRLLRNLPSHLRALAQPFRRLPGRRAGRPQVIYPRGHRPLSSHPRSPPKVDTSLLLIVAL